MSFLHSFKNWLTDREDDPDMDTRRQQRAKYAQPVPKVRHNQAEAREAAEPEQNPSTVQNNQQSMNVPQYANNMQQQNYQQAQNYQTAQQFGNQQQIVQQYAQSPAAVGHVEYIVLLRSRNECKDVIAYIKANASVFLNMEFIASDNERQRCVDMLSGAAYTLGCSLNKISPRGIYLISSPSVRVITDPAMSGLNTSAEARAYTRPRQEQVHQNTTPQNAGNYQNPYAAQAAGRQQAPQSAREYPNAQYSAQPLNPRNVEANPRQQYSEAQTPNEYTAVDQFAARRPVYASEYGTAAYNKDYSAAVKENVQEYQPNEDTVAAQPAGTPTAMQANPAGQKSVRTQISFGPGSPTERFRAQDIVGAPGSYGNVMTNPDSMRRTNNYR